MQQSQQERYSTDPMYRRVVDTLENLIQEFQLTPSEVRDAAMLACIHHEMRNPPRPIETPESVLAAMDTLTRYRRGDGHE